MNTEHIKELEARVIERAQFWTGYIDMLIRLRNEAGYLCREPLRRDSPSVAELRSGLQRAASAALELMNSELAQCFMLSGVGGERAAAYAKERAEEILGPSMEFAERHGFVPTYWYRSRRG